METGLDRRGAMPYPWQGRPRDLPLDEEYALRDDKLNANWRQLMEAIGKPLITGVMCTEGTVAYGASTITHCRITLPDDFTELNDWLNIGDGARQWRVKVLVENEIEFSDADLIGGLSGTANYNTIQNSLLLETLSKEKLEKQVTKNEIVLGSFDDGLHADDIGISKTDTTKIKTKLDLFDIEHKTDGVHKDDIIENSMLDKDDVLITQSFVNRVKNGAFNINLAASRDYWLDVGSPVVTINSNGKTAFPYFDCEIDSDALGEGIRQGIFAVEKGQPVRLCFWAKGNSGGEAIKAQIYDGVVSVSSEITLTNAYAIYYLDYTPEEGDVTIRIMSNTSATIKFFLALITFAMGDVHTFPERSSLDVIYDTVHTMAFWLDDLVKGTDTVFAQWTKERSIKLLRGNAYCQVAVGGGDDAVIRLTDGTNNFDVTVADGQQTGEQTTDLEFTGNDYELKVMANATNVGSKCIVVYQYRMT